MENEPEQGQATSALLRDVSRRGMEWFLVLSVLLIVFFVVIVPTFHTDHDHRPVVDMSNLRQILMVAAAFAADNNGRLPAHIHLADEYLQDESVFVSPYDEEQSLDFDKTVKRGWYQYGSYWFLSSETLTLDSAVEVSSVVLAYRTPREENDFYIVGFFDGSVQTLDEQAFDELMDRQEDLLSVK